MMTATYVNLNADKSQKIYVVVADRDGCEFEIGTAKDSPVGPIVFETYFEHGTLEHAKRRIASLRMPDGSPLPAYGRTRLARLVFVDDDEEESQLAALVGHRRLLAAKHLKWMHLPCIIKFVDDDEEESQLADLVEIE